MAETLRVQLQLESLSPLAFGARRGTASSFVDTLDYIPGSSLRGAVAARFLREIANADDERFRKIFIEGDALFANLYPVSDTEISQDGDQKEISISRVLPSTAYACKAYKEKHGVKDILMRAAALKLMEPESNATLLDEILLCSRCHQAAHRLVGFYEKPLSRPSAYDIVEVNKRYLTHVGINRKKQAAERGFLFAQQVINEARREDGSDRFMPQLFSGELIVAKTQAEFLTGKLLAEGTELRMGESRTRGLGRVRVKQRNLATADTVEKVKERIVKFNQRFSTHDLSSTDRRFIVLTLQSDAVLTDEFMRPKTSLGASDIQSALDGEPGAELMTPTALRLVYANAGTRLAQTWNVASGYPKPDDITIRTGSVFLFEVTEGRVEDMAAPLTALQECGVGKRRSEGFGRVSICDSFHLEVENLWLAI